MQPRDVQSCDQGELPMPPRDPRDDRPEYETVSPPVHASS